MQQLGRCCKFCVIALLPGACFAFFRAILLMRSAATLVFDQGPSPQPDESHSLATAALDLRPIDRSDVAAYAEMLSDPAVMKYIGLDAGHTFSWEEVESLVTGALQTWAERGYGRWSIFERSSGAFVGFCGFRCEDGVPELITVINERFWGTGYAVDAVKRCLDHAFESFGFTEVCSFTRPTNQRARTMLERIGAEFLGIIDFHGVDGAAYRILPAI